MKKRQNKPYVNDGFVNINKNLGTQKDWQNKTTFTQQRRTSRAEANDLYSFNWLAARVIDVPIDEATREWRDMTIETPEQEKEWNKYERKLNLKQSFNTAQKWALVFGGAVIVIVTDENTMDQELNIDRITKDTKCRLIVLDRYNITADNVNKDILSENFGKPDYYTVNEGGQRVHFSRVIRFEGVKSTIFEARNNNYWGNSIYDKIYEPIQNSQTSTQLINGLLYESNVDAFKINGLNELVAGGRDEVVTKRISLANQMKSTINGIVLDKEDDYINITKNFAGLAEIDDKMLLKVSAASGIPFTKLIGKSADGMNATGEGDLKNYYDMVKSDVQEGIFREKLDLIDEIISRKIGVKKPDYEFKPLYQMSKVQLAEVENKRSQTDNTYLTSGVISELDVLKNLEKNGTYEGLGEKIAELESEPSFSDLDE